MENSYADSGDSSPRSRDIDSENHSWEDQPPANYRVKFMCSYNGKIQPRPHDNQLTYVGGDTKILAVDRSVRFADIMSKLSALANSDVVFKYQLPGEDLDALISVTNDEDLEHMMVEYDRVYRLSPKPPRLRLFLFPNRNLFSKSSDSNDSDSKLPIQPNQQWLADSVNSVPAVPAQLTDKPPQNTQDFLFPDKMINLPETLIPVNFSTDVSARLVEDRNAEESVMSPTMISQVEIQRQIQQLQRMQIANQEQAMFRKNSDEALARAFHADYYQNVQEKTVAAAVTATATAAQPGYWQQHDINGGGGYNTGAEQHPVYLIPPQQQATMFQPSTTMMPSTTMYQQAGTPVSGQVGQINQGYYAMPRGQPEVYREQPVFSVGPPQPKMIARPGGGGGVGVGVGVAETGYTQVAYDSAGRQVFYTAAPGSVMPGAYPTVVGTGGVDLRQVAPLNVTQEGKVATTTAV